MEEKDCIIFNNDNFNEEVLKSEHPVLVDFWAPWCGPCRLVGLIIDEIAKEYQGRIKVGKLNVDENESIAYRYGIRSIPTIVLFKNGKPVDQIIGAVPKHILKKMIDNNIVSN
ncbi:MAG: thioredoxin [Deltaproteobacteria bacterium]|nr:thioredoxin [Deltaproteobacteria bacterium]